MIDVYEYAKKNNLIDRSAIGDKKFRDFFKKMKINVAVEIGTYKGISSAYMAQFANSVYTFDIIDYFEKYKIWGDLEVLDKISYYTISKRAISKNFENIELDKKLKKIRIKNKLEKINLILHLLTEIILMKMLKQILNL